MSESNLSRYTTCLEESFSHIVKEYNKLQLADYTKDTIIKGSRLVKDGSVLLSHLKSHLRSIETLLSDCSNFVEEVTEDLSQPVRADGYVYHTKNGMLSYLGKDFITKKLLPAATSSNSSISNSTSSSNSSNSSSSSSSSSTTSSNSTTNSNQPAVSPPVTLERIVIPDIGYKMQIHQVTDLKNIPPALYYYKAPVDGKYQSGIYLRISGNNLVRIPTPEVVDSKKEYDRKHSIRCKYKTKGECDDQRQKMAKVYNSTVRICNFAHEGDKLVKIGYPSRCPAVPSYGNPTTMSSDIKQVAMSDIKNTLMYGLSDILAAAIWFDYTNSGNNVYDRIEMV